MKSLTFALAALLLFAVNVQAADPEPSNPYDRLIEVTAELAQLAEDLKASALTVVATQEALQQAEAAAEGAIADYDSTIDAIAATLEDLAEVLEELKNPPIPPEPEPAGK